VSKNSEPKQTYFTIGHKVKKKSKNEEVKNIMCEGARLRRALFLKNINLFLPLKIATIIFSNKNLFTINT